MDPASFVSTSGSPPAVFPASEELPLPLLGDADEIIVPDSISALFPDLLTYHKSCL